MPFISCDRVARKIPHLRSCWAPFIRTDLRRGSKLIAAYTATLSVLSIMFIGYLIATQLWNPVIFKEGVRGSLLIFGGISILIMLVLLLASILLPYAIDTWKLGLILPWICVMGLVIIMQLFFGIFLLIAYNISLGATLVVLFDFLWMSYNIYCNFVVLSQYGVIVRLLYPNITIIVTEH